MDRKLEEDRRRFQLRMSEIDHEFEKKSDEMRESKAAWPLYRTIDDRPYDRRGSFSRELSEMKDLGDRFEVALDVKDYDPEDLKVTTHNNTLIIEGKHEETRENDRAPNDRYRSRNFREFTRRYTLPSSIIIDGINSKLSADGKLTIEAPKRNAIEPADRKILIIHDRKG